MNFYLFFIHPDLKDLLIEELKRKHPKLNLSFSNKEFLSMKGPEGYEKFLKKHPLIFAKRMAIFLGKGKEPKGLSLKLKTDEFWYYKTIKTHCDTYDLPLAERPEKAPARAWHKIQEACNHFDWKIKKGDSVIEIGSAPGGISYFILEQGAKLTAIDPAEMSKDLEGFTHIKESIFEVKKKQLPRRCDWLISDLNLKGDLNIKQCRWIADQYPELKGGFITIKTPKDFDVKHMRKWADEFNEFNTFLIHLPSHKREIGLFFKKDD